MFDFFITLFGALYYADGILGEKEVKERFERKQLEIDRKKGRIVELYTNPEKEKELLTKLYSMKEREFNETLGNDLKKCVGEYNYRWLNQLYSVKSCYGLNRNLVEWLYLSRYGLAPEGCIKKIKIFPLRGKDVVFSYGYGADSYLKLIEIIEQNYIRLGKQIRFKIESKPYVDFDYDNINL